MIPFNPEPDAMTPETVMTLSHDAMRVTMLLAAPLLLVALVVGLVVSLFQAATQINESTLTFIPKLAAIAITLVIAGPWMLTTMIDYMRQVLLNVPNVAN
jgi:flagellar biosynthesis protein FliQ